MKDGESSQACASGSERVWYRIEDVHLQVGGSQSDSGFVGRRVCCVSDAGTYRKPVEGTQSGKIGEVESDRDAQLC